LEEILITIEMECTDDYECNVDKTSISYVKQGFSILRPRRAIAICAPLYDPSRIALSKFFYPYVTHGGEMLHFGFSSLGDKDVKVIINDDIKAHVDAVVIRIDGRMPIDGTSPDYMCGVATLALYALEHFAVKYHTSREVEILEVECSFPHHAVACGGLHGYAPHTQHRKRLTAVRNLICERGRKTQGRKTEVRFRGLIFECLVFGRDILSTSTKREVMFQVLSGFGRTYPDIQQGKIFIGTPSPDDDNSSGYVLRSVARGLPSRSVSYVLTTHKVNECLEVVASCVANDDVELEDMTEGTFVGEPMDNYSLVEESLLTHDELFPTKRTRVDKAILELLGEIAHIVREKVHGTDSALSDSDN